MFALSMWQPWATLHVAPCAAITPSVDNPHERRAKVIETRSWSLSSAPLDMGSLPVTIAIHATKSIGRDDRHAIIQNGGFIEPFGSLLNACGFSMLDPWGPAYDVNFERRREGFFSVGEGKYLKPLPRSAVIGVVTYYRQVRGTDVLARRAELATGPRRYELDLGYFDETREKRFGWVSRNAVMLPEPIKVPGSQKLWRLPRDVAQHPEMIVAVRRSELKERP